MRKSIVLLLVLVFLTAPSTVKPISALSEIENSWTTKAPMPKALNGAKAAAVNGKIYVIGYETNLEYDPDTDTWNSKKPMPTARIFFQIAVYQNKIYTMGGRVVYKDPVNSSIIAFTSNANEVYDPSTDTWENKKPMPTNISDIEASVVNGQIHLIGADSHDVYDVTTDSWITKKTTRFPYPIYEYSSAVVDCEIYMIGRNQTQIYDSRSDSWRIGASPQIAVSNAAAGVTTGVFAPTRIYVIGGSPTGSWGWEVTDAVQVYNPETGNWTCGESMPTARGWLEVVVVKDRIYAIGGKEGGICPTLKVNEQYTPFGYKTDFTPPEIAVQSPENTTYSTANISLSFTVNETVSWIRYSIDAQDNVTITGNTTLSQLSYDLHNITVYAQDTAGNIGASETIAFTIAKPEPEPGSFQTIAVMAASGALAIAVAVGMLVYFKKRKH